MNEKLQKLETILKRMWMHDHDGSELFPVPERFWTSENHFNWDKIFQERKRLEYEAKTDPSQSLLFEVMYQEVVQLFSQSCRFLCRF